MLERFGPKLNVAVIGSSGGIGQAIVAAAAALANVHQVYALSRRRPTACETTVSWHEIDITNEPSIAAAASELRDAGAPHIVVVTTGLLHDGPDFQPEKDWRQLDADRLARSFAINAIGPAIVAKHMLTIMPKDRMGVFAVLSARVGSISDNALGGWYGYRASKAALNMVLQNLAIELQRKNRATIAVGLHPGTVDTQLSQPFQANTRPGQLVQPDIAARNLLSVIGNLRAEDSGGVFAWDGVRIPA
ncbi:MAG: SDR family NAD(P)-dependent oxidoreductase [Pseudomonadota bacterium]